MVLPQKHGRKKRSSSASLKVVKAHCKSFRKRVAAAKAEAFKQAQKAASNRACRLVAAKLYAYKQGLKARKVASNETSRKQHLDAYLERLRAKQKASRKRIAAARLQAIRDAQIAQKVESVRECKKRIVVVKVEAYQKASRKRIAAARLQ